MLLAGLPGSGMLHAADTVAPTPQYRIVDRGPSLVRTLVNTPGLNARGSLAIWKTAGTGSITGVVLLDDRTMTIAGVDRFPVVYPADINDSETVVGILQAQQDMRFTRAFKWTGGAPQMLGNLGGAFAAANAINAAGVVAGSAQTGTGARHAVLWQGAQPQDLGLLGRGDTSNARDINDKGDVAGEANVEANGKPHAFVWHAGVMQRLPDLAGGTFCSAQALNNAGEVVGSCDLAEGSAHGVLWRNGHPQDLGTLGDEDAPSTALDINAGGQVVGSSEIAEGKLRAFLWQGGKMADLNNEVAPKTGWLLLVASRMNDRGEIAGRGFYHGAIHAFVLEPIAPARP